MAGEWLALDINLPDKPEVQELIDLTNCPVEAVVFRLYRLWSWASMNCADGTARMTLQRLVRTCGGDEAFWLAVQAVGWLEVDAEAGTVAVPGWDRRFSKSAKARLQHRDRAAAQSERRDDLRLSAGDSCASAQQRRGKERTDSSSSAREVAPEAWETLREAWRAGPGTPYTPVQPPSIALERLSEPEWLPVALEAIGRLKRCHYFQKPVPLTQFCKPGFALAVMAGQYDDRSEPRGKADDKPPPRVDPAFEAARAATLAREEARRQAEHRRLDELASDDDGELSAAKAAVLRKLREGVA